MNTTIKKYDKDSPLPSEMAEQITKFFKKNYPIYHSLENKEKDLSKRTSHKALNALLNEGRTIFTVQDVQKKVLGLLEMREINQGEGIYMQLVWIIVDTLARWQWLASKLHETFNIEAKERASHNQKPSCLLLAVHPDNPAKTVYENWWYKTDNRVSSDGKLFMFKDL